MKKLPATHKKTGLLLNPHHTGIDTYSDTGETKRSSFKKPNGGENQGFLIQDQKVFSSSGLPTEDQ